MKKEQAPLFMGLKLVVVDIDDIVDEEQVDRLLHALFVTTSLHRIT